MMFYPKSHPHKLGLFLALVLTGSGSFLLHAALLRNEPFSYPNGPLATVSGGVWATHSGIAGQLAVASGRANLSTSNTEDVNAPLAGQPYPATTNTVLHASFTANFTSLPGSYGDYFAHFKDPTGSNFRAKRFALSAGDGSQQFRLGIANGSNAVAAATHAARLNLNRDYRVYLRYVINTATTALWVDPISEASLSVTAGDRSLPRAVVAFRTDLLPSPPRPLLAGDAATASDHLPVVMVFNYPDPPLQVTLTPSNAALDLRWPALVGRN